MNIDTTLPPPQALQSPSLASSRPDLPRVSLMSAHPITTTAGRTQAIPETLALDKVEFVVRHPAVLEKAGYRHGGIND